MVLPNRFLNGHTYHTEQIISQTDITYLYLITAGSCHYTQEPAYNITQTKVVGNPGFYTYSSS